MDKFVLTEVEVEPLDTLGFSQYDTTHPARAALFPPLQEQVKKQGLWACHLGPELGGPGYGQFKLALMNLILGRSKCASKVFGTAAPGTGNSEILAHYGTPEQKEKYLGPLINDKISSCCTQ
jgi:acyl-CoA dehydrogenase